MDVEATALGPTMLVAIDQYSSVPLVHDPYAGRMLPLAWRIPLWLCRFSAVRRALVAASDRSGPGAWISLLCRKRYIDDALRRAAQHGLDAIVIVGAGLDTRAYRVAELAGVPVWEIDLPANIAAKTRALHRCFGHIPANVTLVPMDLAADDLPEQLVNSGFDPTMRTFFIWESVTMYLAEPAVRKTLQSLARCATESRLVFTYFLRDFVDGQAMYGAQAAYQRFVTKKGLWVYGIDPADVAGLLGEYGWQQTEHVGPDEYRERYLAPAGRLQPVSEIERAVCAEHTNTSTPSDSGAM
ncbi:MULTISPECIES: SAM-dependent methyltransferase [Mycobacterium]|uniref:S-adenosyl-L-methionine-dependent methyltransferase n=1 Tax=Mycobacterium syngnathidarum TaxID=1908205 RepID=A0A1Q9W7E1_9MYCO|nr:MULTISPECIES: SAM-dependent methyltransferase [Mycobacterium]MCG7609027.1 SAM-dependent methyltransferase [Mycobacterium sp. CnD-18-1]OHT96403.1 methyltransferase [Mycobacterium syngnathidarum]OLT93262.1 methyltransferase [Mycobacterium syngnathidarum]